MPHLEVITPHELNIIPDSEYGEPVDLPSNTAELGVLRADEPFVEKLGSVCLGRSTIPVGQITYGEAVGVPPTDLGAYYVTSKLSISAALRTPGLEQLAPRLLYPFAPVYDPKTGQCLGSKGLALPKLDATLAHQKASTLPPVPLTAETIENTCPFPFKVYDLIAPDVVSRQDIVAHEWQASAQPMRVMYGETTYLPDLSEQLGVPVFQPEVIGVQNDRVANAWQLCHLDVPTAMGNAAMHLVGGDLVRSSQTGQMCGFRALNRIAQQHFDEPVF
ncbi:MAG TPA: hypothetical protein VJ843_04270 [Candidatus Saccharimonadales bacterium]|nr:hypothetical protein [Candidatus Saccharimonadales bacterium]